MSVDESDFRLDGYQAATLVVAELFWEHLAINEADLYLLAQHHTPNEQHSYFVLHDASATWGFPGEPQIVALHLQRDTKARTFRFQHATLPLPVMAQSWLIARGCPKDAIRLHRDIIYPSDETTMALEERVMSDGDSFALIASYTNDSSTTPQTAVVLRALDKRTSVPFRVLLEQVDLGSGLHTLREGAFATMEVVTDWWERYLDGQEPLLPPLPPSAGPGPAPGIPPRPAPTASAPTRGR